ncbi:hypothetical protein [Agromyces sp. PvR057]|uniref:hypothetical protein n=1 Tax=Agromyces sp. PvR057 TaxID=3156403 RepID=UPI0033913A51
MPNQERDLRTLEWWPDYGGDLFFLREGAGGSRVTLDEMGLSVELREGIRRWLLSYDDSRLPIDGPGDPVWIEEGVRLLAAARAELADRCTVVVTEDWWREPASDR